MQKLYVSLTSCANRWIAKMLPAQTGVVNRAYLQTLRSFATKRCFSSQTRLSCTPLLDIASASKDIFNKVVNSKHSKVAYENSRSNGRRERSLLMSTGMFVRPRFTTITDTGALCNRSLTTQYTRSLWNSGVVYPAACRTCLFSFAIFQYSMYNWSLSSCHS